MEPREARNEILKSLALVGTAVVLVFGVDPALLWAALVLGLLPHVNFWDIYLTWLLAVMLAVTYFLVRYLSEDESTPHKWRGWRVM